ncbi:MAG: glycosyltransferase family 4 protein, partial [Candidatus Omnitrophica bacterium]|nr:glycosyltransferase family 4 protein [Candidatus Omnitrophota bacterium]
QVRDAQNAMRKPGDKRRRSRQEQVKTAMRDVGVLFDAEFYRSQVPIAIARLSDRDLLAHYIEHGAGSDVSPHPLFDTLWYRRNYAPQDNPLMYFVLTGAEQGHDPHPLFDTAYYRLSNKSLAESGDNPLVHYVQVPLRDKKDPHPLFDIAFYAKQCPEAGGGTLDPLVHYVSTGQNLNPNPLFDVGFYCSTYPDVPQSGMNPLIHYITGGFAKGYRPHPDVAEGYAEVSLTEAGRQVLGTGSLAINYALVSPFFNRLLTMYFSESVLDFSEELLVGLFRHYCLHGLGVWRLYEDIRDVLRESGEQRAVRTVDASPAPHTQTATPLRLLYICGMFPNTSHAGGLRLFDIIRLLSRRHQIDIYAVYHPSQDAAGLEALQDYAGALRLVSRDIFDPLDICRWLDRLGRTEAYYDVVHLEYPNSIPVAEYLRPYAKKIGFTFMECVSRRDALDVAVNLQGQETERARDALRTFIRHAAMEQRISDQADFTVVLTPEDQAYVKKFNGIVPEIVPTGISEQFWAVAADDEADIRYSAAFVGYFDHYPNVDAMRWYFREIHPRLKQAMPEYSLLVIGGGDTRDLKKLVDGDVAVDFTGYVTDLVSAIRKAKICISPLINGAGFRGKINQYAAVGRPSVATPLALQGTPYVHAESVLIAETAADFADQMRRLLTDAALYATIKTNCGRVAREHFSWDAQIKKLEAIYYA